MTTPDSRQINYTYNFNNLLTGITTPDMGNFAFAYDAANRRTTRTLPNGTVSTYNYDDSGRLTGIETTLNQATIDSLTYTMDNVGNRISKTQNSMIVDYTYDNIYRLTGVSPTGTNQQPENYTYDAVGNRLTSGNEQFPQTNETAQYSYDHENRLTGVTITEGSLVKQLTFAYDPFGRRISKTIVQDTIGTDCTSPNTCPRTTNYVYDGQSIIMEYDQNDNITAKYTHGPNIDEPLAVQQGTSIYYYHADGLGSITGLSNTSGTIVQTYAYDSFGNMTSTGSISQPFTYTAREYDSETGMYFYRARYYDPKVGRFVTKDPIGFKGGDYNLYGYVGNNPVNRVDPSGLKPISKQSCAALRELIRYDSTQRGPSGTYWKYNPFSSLLLDLNATFDSTVGPVDVDWMLRLSGLGMAYYPGSAKLDYSVLKRFWNIINGASPTAGMNEPGHANAANAAYQWIHNAIPLSDMFAPALKQCACKGW